MLLKQCYTDDTDFSVMFNKCHNHVVSDYYILKGFIFKGNQLCIPRTSVLESLIIEFCEGGLAGHLGIESSTSLVCEYFYWSKLARDLEFLIQKWLAC